MAVRRQLGHTGGLKGNVWAMKLSTSIYHLISQTNQSHSFCDKVKHVYLKCQKSENDINILKSLQIWPFSSTHHYILVDTVPIVCTDGERFSEFILGKIPYLWIHVHFFVQIAYFNLLISVIIFIVFSCFPKSTTSPFFSQFLLFILLSLSS